MSVCQTDSLYDWACLRKWMQRTQWRVCNSPATLKSLLLSPVRSRLPYIWEALCFKDIWVVFKQPFVEPLQGERHIKIHHFFSFSQHFYDRFLYHFHFTEKDQRGQESAQVLTAGKWLSWKPAPSPGFHSDLCTQRPVFSDLWRSPMLSPRNHAGVDRAKAVRF